MASEPDVVTRWRELLTSYTTVSCDLDRALQNRHGISLSEFEVLDRLADRCGSLSIPRPDASDTTSSTGTDRCRMLELAADMYLSQSALSRTVARLEKGGFVTRGMCEDDRRSIFVRLTEAGHQRHNEARDTHRAVLAEHLG